MPSSFLNPAISAGLVRSPEQIKQDIYERYFAQYADQEAKLIEQGYGDLVGANYWNKLVYKPGILDKFIGSLGGRTGEDKFWENASAQYGQNLLSLAEQGHQEEYDSEVAKAGRMRAAGENPDLLGTGDVANSPGLSEDTENSLPSNEDIGSMVSSIGERLMSLIPTAMGFVSDLRQFKALGVAIEGAELSNQGQAATNAGIGLDNDVKRANLFTSIIEGTKTGLSAFVPASPIESVAGPLGEKILEPSISDQRVMARDRYIKFVTQSDLPERVKKQMVDSANVLYDSIEVDSDVTEKRTNRIGQRIAYSRAKQSKFYDGIFGELDTSLDRINKRMTEINDATQEFYFTRMMYENKNAASYGQKSDELGNPIVQATQEGLQMPLQTASIAIDNAYKKLMSKINDAEKGLETDLRELANSGGFWNKALYYSLMGLRMAGAGIGMMPGKAGGLSFGLGF